MSSASTRTSTSPIRSSRESRARAGPAGLLHRPRSSRSALNFAASEGEPKERRSRAGVVLGVDPGTTGMGYAVLRGTSVESLEVVSCGVVDTPRASTNAGRLQALGRGLGALIRAHAPDAVAVERLFFNRNARTAMAVGEARGVALLCAARARIPVFEYTPQQVKLAVAGHGRADKRAVQSMLQLLLRLERPIRQDDAADAVAVALCHAQTSRVTRLMEASAAPTKGIPRAPARSPAIAGRERSAQARRSRGDWGSRPASMKAEPRSARRSEARGIAAPEPKT